jgi:hypothetical protein
MAAATEVASSAARLLQADADPREAGRVPPRPHPRGPRTRTNARPQPQKPSTAPWPGPRPTISPRAAGSSRVEARTWITASSTLRSRSAGTSGPAGDAIWGEGVIYEYTKTKAVCTGRWPDLRLLRAMRTEVGHGWRGRGAASASHHLERPSQEENPR